MKEITGLLTQFMAVAILSFASIFDIRERRIPDWLVSAGAAAGLVLSAFGPERRLQESLLGGITAGSVLLLLYFASKGGLGLGDVKLFGCAGIYLGPEGAVSAMAAASMLSGLYGLILICISRGNKKREIPFAPFILAGALAAIFL